MTRRKGARLWGLIAAMLPWSTVLAGPAGEEIDSMSTLSAHQCTLVRSNGVMTITTGHKGADAAVEMVPGSPGPEGPAEIHFRMKTSLTGELGEYLVYWTLEEGPPGTFFERIPFRPDGRWHAYRLPLAATGIVKTLRFTFGVQPHQLQLAEPEIRPAPEVPGALVARRSRLPSALHVEGGGLSLTLEPSDHRYRVADHRTGRTWESEPVSPWLVLVDASVHDDRTLELVAYDRFAQARLPLRVTLQEEGVITFRMDSHRPDTPIHAARFFPPRFSTAMEHGQVVFCDRSCGVRLDHTDPTYNHWPLRVYGNTHCLDMPWIGVYDEQRGDGLMLLVETPADAEMALVPDAAGRHWPEVRWLPSLDTFRYPRVASLHFTTDHGHVGLARAYRRFLRERGRFRTLKDKARDKPAVARLRGAPSLWGARYPTKWVRQMRPLGITRGVIGQCREPGLVAWLNQLGYLTGRYDNYTDFVEGPTGFQRDAVPEAAVHSRPGGGPKRGWLKRSGEQMYWRSSARWPAAEASYVPRELAEIPYTARFIDVAAAGDLLEDFFPGRLADRREDLANRRAVFARMNERGLVLGTEHGNDWVVDLVEYFEGTMSGPFWWSSWPAGHLDRPTREQLTPRYLRYGMGYANRIPLWELVYHDCAQTTWYWGDTAGLLYEAAPELADRKDLFNLLYGTPPLIWMNGTGYRFPEDLHRMLRTFHDTCHAQHAVAFEAMTDHAFLSEDRAVQRTRFSNGAETVVNFSDEPRPYTAQGREVELAPRGYLMTAPDFSQSRLWVDGSAQTRIRGDGLLIAQGDGIRPVAGVISTGRFTALRIHPDRWNVFVDPENEYDVATQSLTGWKDPGRIRLCTMDDLGESHRTVARADAHGRVRFTSTETVWRYVIIHDRSDRGPSEGEKEP